MPKVRQDAWSHEDDLLLAETVLRHIREGSTQLKAFDEVGDVLNRTSAACGFRWNAEIRQKYEQAVELAKKQRKEKKRNEASFAQPVMTAQPKVTKSSAPPKKRQETVTNLSQVISYLETLQDNDHKQTTLNEELQKLEEENQTLIQTNQKLQSQLDSLKEDYQAFISIMDRARKMTMFEEQEIVNKPFFRMEKNGNLEHLAK
ncbi:transcriptional regulator [Halobacillus andaensis]|uniref:Transcriptional regulator n=1 Tax=Halobacillus andaensis TaxID=1176239 RepID=A0A917AZX3_HALAA|nr:RsfA family transcriptional regulator [Halobacillus andaensis]MBP2002989.1 prespore-specific regulator [Halobacillus andaensis]GGF07180.1 transcriptional regulator [Halobacillus andaensis]